MVALFKFGSHLESYVYSTDRIRAQFLKKSTILIPILQGLEGILIYT